MSNDFITAIKNYVDQNKYKILAGVVITGSVVNEVNNLLRNINRNKNLRNEKMFKDRYVYDRSTGVYIKTRRPMKQDEKIEYSIRKRRGESPVNILRSMRLL